jgi:hypothetical protein
MHLLGPRYMVFSFISFTHICNNVSSFNGSNPLRKENLLHQGYRFHMLLNIFIKFYYRCRALNSTWRDLINNGISKPCFMGM